MDYKAKTIFQKFHPVEDFETNVAGKFFSGTSTKAAVNAGVICKKVSRLENEAFSGVKNTNTWHMEVSAAGAEDEIYFANNYNIRNYKDPVSGVVLGGVVNTLGLPIPEDIYGTFTKAKIGEPAYVGEGNFTAEVGTKGFATIADGYLTPVETKPSTAGTAYFEVEQDGVFQEGVMQVSKKYRVVLRKA